MKRQYKLMVLALGVVAILIAAVATTAFAAQKGSTPDAAPTLADYQAWGCPLANGYNEAITGLLGMTSQEIETQLEQGKSLVEIAASKGVSEDKLVAAILDLMKQYMQQQVTSGAWTQTQMDSHLKLAEQHIRQVVNAKRDNAGHEGCGGEGMMDNGGMMGSWGANSGSSLQGGGMMDNGGMMGGGFRGMMRGSY